jgi:hypothetical protein
MLDQLEDVALAVLLVARNVSPLFMNDPNGPVSTSPMNTPRITTVPPLRHDVIA